MAGVVGVGVGWGVGVGVDAAAARGGACFFTGMTFGGGACCGASNIAAAKDFAATGAVPAGVSATFGAVRGSSGNSPSPNATESLEAGDERGFFDFCFVDLGSSVSDEFVCRAGVVGTVGDEDSFEVELEVPFVACSALAGTSTATCSVLTGDALGFAESPGFAVSLGFDFRDSPLLFDSLFGCWSAVPLI